MQGWGSRRRQARENCACGAKVGPPPLLPRVACGEMGFWFEVRAWRRPVQAASSVRRSLRSARDASTYSRSTRKYGRRSADAGQGSWEGEKQRTAATAGQQANGGVAPGRRCVVMCQTSTVWKLSPGLSGGSPLVSTRTAPAPTSGVPSCKRRRFRQGAQSVRAGCCGGAVSCSHGAHEVLAVSYPVWDSLLPFKESRLARGLDGANLRHLWALTSTQR